jgi:pilus assembly protein CpaB
VTARRRRGFLLLAVALASGGLAASRVHEHERRVAERVGPEIDVLVAARDLRDGARVTRDALALRSVPARFVPRDALASPAGVIGARMAAAVAVGGYITAGLVESSNGGHRGEGIRRGRRAVTVEVVGGGALAALAPGARADVLVSTESAAGGRTVMALAGAEVLHVEPGTGYGAGEGYAGGAAAEAPAGSGAAPVALATLRVTVRQAVYLTAADNFAREIRLLARPPGDRSPAGVAISQAQL